MGIQEECETLQKIPMFRDVAAAKLKLFAMSGQRITYEAGEVLFRQDDEPDAVYVILEGLVDIIREDGPQRVRVAQLGEGTMVGETGVMCSRERTATVEAATPVCVLQIDKHTFNQVIGEVPQLSLAIARELANRVEEMNRRLVSQSSR